MMAQIIANTDIDNIKHIANSRERMMSRPHLCTHDRHRRPIN